MGGTAGHHLGRPTRDIDGVWKAHHLVHPAARGGEGLPRTILEAAACGRAIVTTDVPGCRSFVRDGQNGMVVPVDDALGSRQGAHRLRGCAGNSRAHGRECRARLLDGHTRARRDECGDALYLSAARRADDGYRRMSGAVPELDRTPSSGAIPGCCRCRTLLGDFAHVAEEATELLAEDRR